MVLYFTSCESDNIIYMGRDKFENEDLIAHGFEEDVWFHADKLSSAHVYLRMKYSFKLTFRPGQTWDNLPEPLLVDLAQLTKANSIQGNKLDNVVIIYTPWSNLKKTAGMETGQVSFHSNKKVPSSQRRSRKYTLKRESMKSSIG
jgi:predicted ribosome quality control (RQC) complex YloA/Tae2 family protein